MYETYSKLVISTPEQYYLCRFGVFIFNLKQISYIVLVLPLLTVNE